MVTWMIHKEHGKHPATGVEIDALKAAGWTEAPAKVKAVPVNAEAGLAKQVELIVKPRKAK